MKELIGENAIRHSLLSVLGSDALRFMEAYEATQQEMLVQAALVCFDNNRNDEHAEVIRQARKELAE